MHDSRDQHSHDKHSPDQHSLDKQRQWWNHWDNEFFSDALRNPDDDRRGGVVLSLLQSLNHSKPEILEVGCANGWFASNLSEHGNVTGVDLADAAVEQARARNPQSTFHAGDILSMDLPPASFDVIVTMETLAHVPDQRKFCSRLRNLLKPHGHLVMTTQNRWVYDRKKPGVFIEKMKQSPESVLARYTTTKELKQIVATDFHVRKMFTIHPHGNQGCLRVINSPKLNNAASRVIPRSWLTTVKEKLGLGQTIVMLAKARAY